MGIRAQCPHRRPAHGSAARPAWLVAIVVGFLHDPRDCDLVPPEDWPVHAALHPLLRAGCLADNPQVDVRTRDEKDDDARMEDWIASMIRFGSSGRTLDHWTRRMPHDDPHETTFADFARVRARHCRFPASECEAADKMARRVTTP